VADRSGKFLQALAITVLGEATGIRIEVKISTACLSVKRKDKAVHVVN
jgi:hypothetical protein